MDKNNAYVKDFDKWNTKKKSLEKRVLPNNFFFLEGEIWWAALGVNIGHEIDGKNELFERPILIFKKQSGDMLLELPVTSKLKNGNQFYAIKYRNEYNTVLLDQPRTISNKRLLRLIFRITNKEFVAIREKMYLTLFTIKTIPSD